MKLNEFVNIFKSFKSKMNEQTSDGRCFGSKGHNLDFSTSLEMLNLYAAENDVLLDRSIPSPKHGGDAACSPELVDIIKKVQKKLKVSDDGIIGKNTLLALQAKLSHHESIKNLQITGDTEDAQDEDSPEGAIESDIRDRLLFVGDSIAYGMHKFGNRKKGESIAVPGDMSTKILSDFTGYISKNPKNTGNKIVILSAGTNDVFSGAIEPGAYLKASRPISNIKKIVSLANQSGYDIYVMKLMEDGKEKRTKLNNHDYYPERHSELVSEVNKFIDSLNSFNSRGVQLGPDGIHPTAAGYKALVSEVLTIIRAEGPSTPDLGIDRGDDEDLPPTDTDTDTQGTDEEDVPQDLQTDPEDTPESTGAMLYDAVNAPPWLKTGAALRLLTILEDFGTEEEILTSMDQIVRSAMRKLKVSTPDDSTPISPKDVRNFQSKVGIKPDGDLGPMTFSSAALLNSKYASAPLSERANKVSKMFNSFGSSSLRERTSKIFEAVSSTGVIDPDKYVDEVASSRALSKAVRALNRSGNRVATPSRAKERKKATPLNSWRDDTEFLEKTENLAKKYGMTRAELLALFWHETAGTMSPRIENSYGYTGLIQFGTMEGGIKYRARTGGKLNMDAPIVSVSRIMGRKKGDEITKKELKGMSRADQVDAVAAYFKMWKIDKLPRDEFMLGRIYCTILYPIARAFGPDEAVMAQSMKDFNHNKYTTSRKQKAINAFKVNGAYLRKQGKRMMTIRDLHKKMRSHIKNANLDF